MAQTEVYAPKSGQLWKTVWNWLTFLFQIFVQIVRGTPSMAQVFSSIGFSHGGQTSFLSPPNSSSSTGFKPLPVVEIPLQSSSATAVDINAVDDAAAAAQPGHGDVRASDKLTVVLDLDDTLVCAYETSSLPPTLCTQATEAGLNWFELDCVSSDKEFEGKPKISYVTVFERPGLNEFLEQLSEFADLILFTAGLEGYARPLVDRIDAGNRFSRRLYRPSTISTEYRDHVKDLSCISPDLCRVVIVDNNPFSFLLQPVNGIPCVPFSAGQPHDDQLLEVLLPLLKHLSVQDDVRPVLYEKFHMPEWFQKHGVPSPGWTL
ncbi:CTD nuclear envelope phosphatase 1 homolog [Chenopodium quinoa]|uniref:CTD nuclear envelope phosphatase 1 homolog n=1 Tax=Chenopodium quinoa TaxID=63459 RepID=UPI000B76E2FA|nr:CTD nuclear envelope phosphatase 1 homolog [Chenopodium quinoa]